MKGWRIDDGECWIIAIAETRGKAKRFWPGDAEFTELRVTRIPWLDDASGPEREVFPVLAKCTSPHDEYDRCEAENFWCFEGEYVDQAATLARDGRTVSEMGDER
jgi:hypothetical protein